MSMQDIPTTAKANPAKRPPPIPPSDMTVEHVRYVGEMLYGSLWKNDMAKSTKVVLSLITCILNRTRQVPHDFPERMRKAAIARIGELAAILVMDGMPDTHADKTRELVRLMMRAQSYPKVALKADDPVPSAEEVPMGAAEFKAVVDVLFGAQGKADSARALGLSKSMITRILTNLKPAEDDVHAKRVRTVPSNVPGDLRNVVMGKLMAIGEVLVVPGMPQADSPQTEGIRALIEQARDLYLDKFV